jgi:L-ascorbate metabolism protein UlaG (beta-lactamase superfamily)
MHGDGITYVGHATTLVELGGTRLLTDPLLRSRVGPIRRIVALPGADSSAGLDAVLISHAHHDHLDVPSLRRIPRDVPVIAPPGCARLVRRTGHDVVEMEAGASIRVGTVDVLAIPAEHDGRRLPVGSSAPAVGYMIGAAARVCFFGDTDLFAAMGELATGLDVALLPVWGWGPRVGPGHLDPERAARAAAMLRPRIAVPIHWGTVARPRVWWRADPAMPARRFATLVGVYAPLVTVRILAPGERLALDDQGQAAG